MRTSFLFCAAVTATLLGSTDARGDLYEITVENLIGPGEPCREQPFSPPVAVVHDEGFSLFSVGTEASEGVRDVAIEGRTQILENELANNPAVHEWAIGQGQVFDQLTLQISGDPGQRFSMVMMLGRTNDLFTGLTDGVLPVADSFNEYMTDVWDAGAEINSGMYQEIPYYGFHDVGTVERGFVGEVNVFTIIDDPTCGLIEWELEEIARITIRNLTGVPTQATTWGSVKALYR